MRAKLFPLWGKSPKGDGGTGARPQPPKGTPQPMTPEPPSGPLVAALDALQARDLSAAELRLLLSKRGFLPPEIEEAFARLEAWGVVSDERAALALLRRRSGRAARGDEALRTEMRGLGLNDELIEATLARAISEPDRALDLLRARYRVPAPVAKAARFLGGRGFGEEAIGSALDRALAEGLLVAPPEPGGEPGG